MRYLVVLETAPGRTDHGVTVPDLPGCTSARDTLDEALGNAQDAILSYLGVLVEDGAAPGPGPVPGPRPAWRTAPPAPPPSPGATTKRIDWLSNCLQPLLV